MTHWLVAKGFALFCLLSGCAYLVNDVRDAAADRLHPAKKKRRPLGAVEAEIMKVEAERATLLSQMEDPAVYGVATKVKEVQDRLAVLAVSLMVICNFYRRT